MKNKKSKKGFTLIELLAVIIVVIVIIAITIPLVSKVKEIVKREAFRATAYSIADAGRFLIANENESQGYQEFYYLDGKEYNADNKKLDYTGKGPKTGVVVLNENNKVVLAIHNGTYCATKSANVNTVTVTKTAPDDCNAYSIIETCDSWEQIALKYDVNLEKLLAANDETDPNSSTCGRDIKIPVSSNPSSGSYAGGGGTTVYYKTYYTVGYVSKSSTLPLSYDYTIKLGVLPLNIKDIKVTRVTMQTVFETLDDFKRYIVKKNMGEVIWPGETPAEIDISQADVFRAHAARTSNMVADDVVVECDTEACYATVSATVDNLTNVNPNTIEGVGQVAYTPIKFTVEFNGQPDTCAVMTAEDATPGTLAGTGAVADPYLVQSVEDLVALSNSVNAGNTYSGKYISFENSFDFIKQKSYKNYNTTTYGDINGNGTIEGLLTELTTGSGFVPIGKNTATFNGTLLGNTECIFNLYINRPSTSYVGLIGYLNGGVVKNLDLNKINITGGSYTGGVAGQNQGSILNMSVQGNVTGTDNVGLVSGYMSDAVISSVFIEGNVKGVNSVGGFLGGAHYWPTIKGVYKGGSVSGTGAGVNRVIGSPHYCDNVGVAVLNTVTVNGSTVTSTMFNNQHGLNISSLADLNNINLAELALDTYIGGDNDGDGYYWDYDGVYNVVRKSVATSPLTFSLVGAGTAADPYLVYNYSDLKQASLKNGSSYKLMADINMSGEKYYMLGSYFNRYSGTFDGNNKKVNNLNIDNPKGAYIGFFGLISGGKVKGLNLLDFNIVGGNYTGGMAGQNQGSILDSNISGDVTGRDNVGLVSGYMSDSVISSVLVDGNVTGVNNVGGFLGGAHYWPSIKGVFKGGSVTGTGTGINRVIGSPHYCDNVGVAVMKNNVTVNGTTITSVMFNNQHGFDITSLSDLNNINLAELALDTYIGGDNDGDGYYWDYDASYNVVRKSVADYPLTFSLTGAGTAADPYLIYNYNDLKQASLKNGSSYKLMADINMSGEKYYMIGSYFNRYSGTFDGNDKTVSNLNIDNPKGSYVGFFGFLSGGVIKKINLLDFNINGSNFIGGIAGQNQGSISNSNITGNVTGKDNVGLVSGYMSDSVISAVFVEGNVTGVNSVGGILGGAHYWPTIKGVYKGGSVTGTGSGVNRVIGSPHYCDNVGVVAMDNITVNGLTVESAMFNNQHGLNISSLSDLNNINLAELALDTYIGGDNDGDGYYWDYDASYNVIRKSVSENPLTFSLAGAGTVADPYLIYNYTDLKQASLKNGASYKLMADINMSGEKYYMIGSYFNRYSGTFDGNNKTVSNLSVNNPKGAYIGFFGYINGGKVKELNLISLNINGGNFTAGMAGQNQGSILDSTISGNVTGRDNVGLVTGYMSDSVISAVFAEGNVTGVNSVGGFVGGAHYWPTIKGVYKGGNVTGTGSGVNRVIGSPHYCDNVGVLVIDTVTANGLTIASTMFNNQHGLNISSISDLNNINLAELALDTYIGGDNDGDGYYWDYDAGYSVVRKSVSENPLTFSLTGAGTVANPYLIYNYNDLKQASLKNGSSYKLMADINLSGQYYYMLGSYFNRYSGTFDGNNKTVSNLNLNNPRGSYLGFFGFVSGKVMGLNLIDFNINGSNYAAGMAGQNQGNIWDSIISGNVTGRDNVGLVTGYMSDTVIRSVVVEGNVTGVNSVGGLVGRSHYWPTIKGVYKGGSVSGTGSGVNRSIGSPHYGDNVNVAVLKSVTVNGSPVICLSGEVEVPCTNGASAIGADISSSDLSSTSTYTNRAFNFSDESLDYIWYVDAGSAKFRAGSL